MRFDISTSPNSSSLTADPYSLLHLNCHFDQSLVSVHLSLADPPPCLPLLGLLSDQVTEDVVILKVFSPALLAAVQLGLALHAPKPAYT